MTLAAGTRLGPYEIVSPLGAGGMGEVFKARDTRLDRTVAIKVLPEQLATDPEFRERFDREARAISQLTHPHICTLYDIGEQAGTAYLVMELLDGETLAARLEKGALPLDQSLTVAIQIASALDKAHRAGITHRDLKPGNIMLTKAGAKLLDFGLAKSSAPVVAGAGLSILPTMAPNLTAQGTILGTFQYMAPEQLEGQEADPRTDIFAFGAVLYEMLTGKKAFEGKSQASLIGAILEREPPPMSSSQPLTPRALERVVKKCLAKEPSERWQSAKDLHDELTWIAAEGATASSATPAGAGPRTTREREAWRVAAAAAAIAAFLAVPTVRHLRETSAPPSHEMRLQITLPSGAPLTSFALSPDGLNLVFESQRKLWLRPLNAEVAQSLAGTDSAIGWALLPFWSSDSQSVGFFADGRLKRIDLFSGVVRIVADVPGFSGMGGAWNSAGTIVFASSSDGSPLYRVSADGGEASPVTRLEPGHRTHRYPQFLPDGHHFIFFARTTDGPGIYLGSIDALETRRVLDSDGSAVFAPQDSVLFARKGALLAQRFDLKEMMPLGNPISVAGHVAEDWTAPNLSLTGSRAISASTNGSLAYRPGAGRYQLVWLDRSGREIGRVGDADEGQPGRPSLSPDQSTLALDRTVGGNTDIWLFDVKQGLARRFTTDAAWDGSSIWSPDGRQIAFSSNRKGVLDIYIKSVDGNDEQPLLESADGKGPTDWSSDGRYLLYHAAGAKTADDLWALPLFGDRKPFVVVQTPLEECCGRFSPDGRWIVYNSDETGRREVYVQSFPGAAGRLRVSTNGAAGNPSWRSDGRELFYLDPGSGQVMAVPIATEGTTLKAGTPVALFRAPGGGMPSRDGQRFLTYSVIEEPSPITILLNWKRPAE